ncbi:hypothetical protein PPYR_11150 [Photinus pyralis]|uniref:Uncharacterized protein n=1 Tax=Photinus pyralis TaxID=7054 RepID=A0A5N4AAG6_PHOPY|nr:uncharacterized protein LOC116175342 [Photinus pyralis]KAB0794311.1 hypothetical protein PPYR_11150 [Photinus pyralis]
MNINMSFGQLDNLIESYASELHQYQDLFQNQALELEEQFMESVENQEKLAELNSRMGVLQCLNYQVDQEIEKANGLLGEFRKKIEYLETEINLHCENVNDEYREKLYGTANTVRTLIHNRKDEIEQMKDNSRVMCVAAGQDPKLETIAKIMMKLLEALEFAEENLEKMKSYIYCINWKYRELEKIAPKR